MAAKPVQMVFSSSPTGELRPLRIRLENGHVVLIDRIVCQKEERFAGNPMIAYNAVGTYEGNPVKVTVKYEEQSRKWWLFRLSKVRKGNAA